MVWKTERSSVRPKIKQVSNLNLKAVNQGIAFLADKEKSAQTEINNEQHGNQREAANPTTHTFQANRKMSAHGSNTAILCSSPV